MHPSGRYQGHLRLAGVLDQHLPIRGEEAPRGDGRSSTPNIHSPHIPVGDITGEPSRIPRALHTSGDPDNWPAPAPSPELPEESDQAQEERRPGYVVGLVHTWDLRTAPVRMCGFMETAQAIRSYAKERPPDPSRGRGRALDSQPR